MATAFLVLSPSVPCRGGGAVAAHDALFEEWHGTRGDLSHVRAAARH
jgi:hypothetical protein